jgi:hypothetical protein
MKHMWAAVGLTILGLIVAGVGTSKAQILDQYSCAVGTPCEGLADTCLLNGEGSVNTCEFNPRTKCNNDSSILQNCYGTDINTGADCVAQYPLCYPPG